MATTVKSILAELRAMGSARNRAGMARYGINVDNAFGVSIYELRKVARRLGTDHDLALALWATGNHEARLLACFVDDPARVTARQMEAWGRDFDSWDICDQATTSLFDQTKHAWRKARGVGRARRRVGEAWRLRADGRSGRPRYVGHGPGLPPAAAGDCSAGPSTTATSSGRR